MIQYYLLDYIIHLKVRINYLELEFLIYKTLYFCFKKLKNSSIEELIESMNISDKYKKFEKDKNRSSLKELSKNDWFVKLFKLKYLDLFSSYYNNEQPLKKLSFFGKTISFSETTKSFYDLLVKNEKSKEDIINAAKIFFFDDKGYFESD